MDLSEKSNAVLRHPWELSRTEIILGELKRIGIFGKVLDIGCGDAFFDKKLLKTFPGISELWGIDIFAEEDVYEGKGNYVNSYEKIEGKKFNYVLLMDVLEHVQDDISFMRGLQKYLAEDTMLLITVPAFQWLFSLHDVELKHFRRYNFKMLRQTLSRAGYCVSDYSYFYLSLILPRVFGRNKTQNIGAWKYAEKSWITRMIKTWLNMDYIVLRKLSEYGVHFGGLSLLAICQREKL